MFHTQHTHTLLSFIPIIKRNLLRSFLLPCLPTNARCIGPRVLFPQLDITLLTAAPLGPSNQQRPLPSISHSPNCQQTLCRQLPRLQTQLFSNHPLLNSLKLDLFLCSSHVNSTFSLVLPCPSNETREFFQICFCSNARHLGKTRY